MMRSTTFEMGGNGEKGPPCKFIYWQKKGGKIGSLHHTNLLVGS